MNAVKHGDRIWSIRAPMRFAGAHFGTRTTIVQLSSGGLWVHSPGPDQESLRQVVDETGERVRYLVAPNRWHHLFIQPSFELYPEAEIHMAPSLEKKKIAFNWHRKLGEGPSPWRGEIDEVAVAGIPKIDETVFFHRDSRSLIMTDMAINIEESPHFWTRTLLKMVGGYGKFGPSRFEKFLTKDKVAFAESMAQVARFDFERVLVTHGEILEHAAKETFLSAFPEAAARQIPEMT